MTDQSIDLESVQSVKIVATVAWTLTSVSVARENSQTMPRPMMFLVKKLAIHPK
jgi:hypothetical protein